MSKKLSTRIIHKHDLEVNWLKATNFVPLQGEFISYDIEVDADGNTLELPEGRTEPYTYERVKLGDGKTVVSSLPFVTDPVFEELEELIGDKKDKDLIVTYKAGSTSKVTHTVAEINEVVNNGGTVKLQKDAELLNLLEVTADFATFYIIYMNINGKLQQKVVAISGDDIVLEQDDIYDYATTASLANKANKTDVYTKTEVNNLELITVDDIDTICGGSIQYAEDVMF